MNDLTYTDISNIKGYKINRNGDIINAKNNRILKEHLCNGYKIITIRNKSYLIHRLVAQTFLQILDNKPIVNHIDCDKYNNRVENLEWVTQKENVSLHNKNISHPKKVIQMDFNNKIINIYNSLKEAGESINMCCSSISKAVLGINNSAGGYIWKYAIDEYNDIVNLSNGKCINYYENYYVFSDGKIYNKIRKKYIKSIKNASGYCYVTLCNKSSKKNFYVHRLVATHFLKNENKNKNQVNHINKKRDDNRLENLEWVSSSENMKHANVKTSL